MKVAVVGGGPAGLYFSLLLKKSLPEHDVDLLERNTADATYGWGVVFSDRTLTSFREADYKTYNEIIDRFIIWDAIDVRYLDQIVRCKGQPFSGIARKALLALLQERCADVGVNMEFEREVTDLAELGDYDLVVAADGVRSTVREAHSEVFRPTFKTGRSRYIWFGTDRVFDSFTFAFRSNEHGFFQAHAYPFDGRMSTFIVECDEESWRAAGLDSVDEQGSINYCQDLFREDLRGHALMSNASRWIQFVTLKNKSWHHWNVELVGDAAHTAHFSIGSGTKMAMEDSIALVQALETHDELDPALIDYELERKPRVERLQEAARQSQIYFESTRHYQHMEPLQFAFHLLSRSGRVDYDDLRVRDAEFVGDVDRWFSAPEGGTPRMVAAPPALAPVAVGSLETPNRVVVAARPTYAALNGVPPPGTLSDLAVSGAGILFTDTVAVSERGRITPGCSGLYTDEQQRTWASELTRVRDRSDAIVAVTLNHSGPRGSTRPRHLVTDVALPPAEAWPLVAASEQRYSSHSDPASELDEAGIESVMHEFRSAANVAKAAGFQMIEIHMGHGYLLGSFLSPLTNHRDDRFGGNASNRLRFPLAILSAVRAEGLPVCVALTASDWARKGVNVSDAIEVARALRDGGCDLIRVLAGQTTVRSAPQYDPYFLTHYADRVRNEAG
ncbi:MAG: anthraniloyl-CoA monooxygenase, partial [Actinomycetota bacterium]|nr:anthraniloyl-CoA monooxygenase [Actinomycetota bacterium]